MLKAPGSIPRFLFHFLTSLLQRRNYAQASVSFFNELATEKKTMLMVLGSTPRFLFHFLTSLPQRRNYARNLCFIF
jgi:hypothetical protein